MNDDENIWVQLPNEIMAKILPSDRLGLMRSVCKRWKVFVDIWYGDRGRGMESSVQHEVLQHLVMLPYVPRHWIDGSKDVYSVVSFLSVSLSKGVGWEELYSLVSKRLGGGGPKYLALLHACKVAAVCLNRGKLHMLDDAGVEMLSTTTMEPEVFDWGHYVRQIAQLGNTDGVVWILSRMPKKYCIKYGYRVKYGGSAVLGAIEGDKPSTLLYLLINFRPLSLMDWNDVLLHSIWNNKHIFVLWYVRYVRANYLCVAMAAARGNMDIVKCLVENGHLTCDMALTLAEEADRMDISEWLRENVDKIDATTELEKKYCRHIYTLLSEGKVNVAGTNMEQH
jgi:hypothetical protein